MARTGNTWYRKTTLLLKKKMNNGKMSIFNLKWYTELNLRKGLVGQHQSQSSVQYIYI